MKREIRDVLLALSILLIVSLSSDSSSSTSQEAAGRASAQTLQVRGRRDRVTVRRDERGIPYIEATNDADLYFAQGYVTASDRLWQMDLLRRTVRGELSEIFGNPVLGQDKTHRVFGFAGILDEAVTHVPANLSVATKAYADGVNAFIDSRTDQNLPPEFLILQYKPRHWTPADSLAVGKLLAEYLSASWQLDLMRASMANLPKDKREALLPETSPLDVLVVGSDRASSKTASLGVRQTLTASLVPDKQVLAQLNDLIENERRSFERLGMVAPTPETIQASNNWVVSGKRATSGKPLLANDPHIPASAPGIWLQTELIAPGLHVAGVTFPGAPGIVLGHNERIACAATNLGPDVQHVYIEKLDKNNPTRYLTPSGWRDAVVRHEQIKVRKSPTDPSTETQTFDVTVTRHGPIVLEKDLTRYALRWPALDPSALESAGLFDANRARNWQEFTAALSRYGGPTQTFVFLASHCRI